MPTEPCPNAEFHGNPFRYCACGWMEEPEVIEAEPRKPAVGKVVLVGCNPAFNNGSPIAPAMITRVWGPACINVRVLHDNVTGTTEQRSSITFVETVEELEGDELNRSYRWTWPPED